MASWRVEEKIARRPLNIKMEETSKSVSTAYQHLNLQKFLLTVLSLEVSMSSISHGPVASHAR